MKTLRYIGFLAVAILFASCAKETAPEKTGKRIVFKAGLADVKSTASATGAFAWSEGDRIYALDIWGVYQQFTLTKGAGTKNAEFTSDEEIEGVSGYAFAGSADVYSWGGVYNYYLTSYYDESEVGQTHSPMVATIPDGPNPSLAFKHLCGLIKVTLKGFTGTLTMVRLSSKDNAIAGDFIIQNIGTENACIETKSIIVCTKTLRGISISISRSRWANTAGLPSIWKAMIAVTTSLSIPTKSTKA